MKPIDWRSVQRDKDLSTQYTVNVFNRLQELTQSSADVSLESTNIDQIYGKLMEAKSTKLHYLHPQKAQVTRENKGK